MAVPGEWKAVQVGGSWQVQDKDGQTIAVIGKGKEAAGRARLISASPYVLEALKAVTALIGDEDLPDNGELNGAAICDLVRSAVEIAK